MRKIIALTAAAGLLVTLAACSTGAPSGACEPTKTSGDASSIVTASGAFGADPEAEFPTPLVADGVQVSTISEGDGDVVYPGQYATVALTLYDGENGDSFGGVYDKESPILLRAGVGASKLGYAVECQLVGSRVAVNLTGTDLAGFQQVTADMFGADHSLVAVIDIYGSTLGKAHGIDQVAQAGMPSVVVSPDGQPGVTIPSEDPPAGLKIAVLKQADGAVVEEGDVVYLHFLRVDWANPASYKSTWDDYGSPAAFTATELDPETNVGMPPGILQAIVGQKVGSQILLVMPPAFGFPAGSEPEGISEGETVVYVFDILGIG